MRRGGRLSPTSRKRIAELRHRPDVRRAVFVRDGGCIVKDWGSCFGPLTVHHLLKASQGGKYTEENLVTLCSFHNDKVECEPLQAQALGLVIKSWEAR
jgi:5-methylcytosine-specific restriction endonuclease McrA